MRVVQEMADAPLTGVGGRLRQIRGRFQATQAEFGSIFGLPSVELLAEYEDGVSEVPDDLVAQVSARLHVNPDYLCCASELMFRARSMSCAAIILRLNDGYVPHVFVWDAGLMFQMVLEKPVCSSGKIVAILPVDCIASLESSDDQDAECIHHLCKMLLDTQRVPRDLIWHFGHSTIVHDYLHRGCGSLDHAAMPEERRVWAHRRLWSHFLKHVGPMHLRQLMERAV